MRLISIIGLCVALACIIAVAIADDAALAKCQELHSYSTCAYALR